VNAPLLLLTYTLALAALVAVLRKERVLVWLLAGIGAGLAALLVFATRLDEVGGVFGLPVKLSGTWTILGRSLVLGGSNQSAVGFVYLLAGFLFAGGHVARPGRLFYAAGLILVGLVAASLMVVPFLYAAVLLECMAIVAVLILFPPEHAARHVPLRMVVLYTLGMILLLIAGWQADLLGTGAAPEDAARTATALAMLGFALLLAVPPFHIWLPSASAQSQPYALAFVLLVSQAGALFLVFHFVDAYAWLREDAVLFAGVRWVAIVMAGFAALWALAQRSLARTAAYALLADTAIILLAFSSMTPQGYQLALGLTGARVIGLSVWALGASVLRNAGAGDTADELSGIGYHAPLATAALLMGLFSLAGFPLTAGFPGRWAVMAGGGEAALAVVGTLAGVSLAAVRWTSIVFRSPRERTLPASSAFERLLLGGGIVLCLLLGLFPQLLYPWVVNALSGLTGLAGG
jgi:formate hydrogenlyase subunit 3/multisubunit Na+/H+ antiporter MnhD subunit